YGHPEFKEVKVRFASGFKPFGKNKTSLLIPISKRAYTFWNLFFWIIFAPLLIIASWVCFILPIKVLYRIAMGNPFSEKNVKNLRLAGSTLILVTLFPIVLSLFVKLIMGSAIPKEIYFPSWLYINDNKGWLIGGISLLIVSNSFKHGMKLKQEQDLTV
ncbi:MAG TPA: DUF2975 domain-containing protein, partial [Chitinophagaceae bacterium]|nr:DUF2975 domain-containing protein [Chitinophagaceae bacterium]